MKVNRKDISNTSDTPIFDYCRKLIEKGVDPETRLEVYRNNSEFDVAVTSIREGAEWTVDHNKFYPYRKSHARNDLKGTQELRQALGIDLNGN